MKSQPKFNCEAGMLPMRFGKAIVRGFSMVPALADRDQLIIRYESNCRVGDVIVFQHQGRNDIKRVDHISEQGIFVLGDNDSASLDSRNYGYISAADVLGTVMFRFKPRWGFIPKKGVEPKRRKRRRPFRLRRRR